MKLWDNIRLLTRDKIPKFEHLRVYYKGERAFFREVPRLLDHHLSLGKVTDQTLNALILY